MHTAVVKGMLTVISCSLQSYWTGFQNSNGGSITLLSFIYLGAIWFVITSTTPLSAMNERTSKNMNSSGEILKLARAYCARAKAPPSKHMEVTHTMRLCLNKLEPNRFDRFCVMESEF